MQPDEILQAASAAGLTIACAESITGGDVVSALIAVSGASAVVLGGVVAYTAEVKVSVLGVDRGVIDRYGVVSEEVALAMARRARELFGASIGLATTGVAGPDPHGGKAPGTVCVASVGPYGETATTSHFTGDRETVRGAAVAQALATIGDATRSDLSHGVTGLEHN